MALPLHCLVIECNRIELPLCPKRLEDVSNKCVFHDACTLLNQLFLYIVSYWWRCILVLRD
jgi:hypothetical protein